MGSPISMNDAQASILPEMRDSMENVLRLLMRRGEISGEEISAELGVTRAAVWKKIELLRAGGIEVDSAPRRGYRLASCEIGRAHV